MTGPSMVEADPARGHVINIEIKTFLLQQQCDSVCVRFVPDSREANGWGDAVTASPWAAKRTRDCMLCGR